MVPAYWLEFKLGSGATVALAFHAFKHAFIVCFLGWKFKTTNISQHVALLIGWTTCNPNLAPGPYEDWRGYINGTIHIFRAIELTPVTKLLFFQEIGIFFCSFFNIQFFSLQEDRVPEYAMFVIILNCILYSFIFIIFRILTKKMIFNYFY